MKNWVTEELIAKTLKNAGELLSEARLLADNSKFARAFSLTHLGTEETAKALALIAAFIPSKFSNFNRLERELRSHKFKIAIANWFDDIMTGEPDSTEEDQKWRKLLVNHNLYNKLKNDSLYVGVGSEPSFPAELFSGEAGESIVKAYLSISESRYGVATEMIEDALVKIKKGTVNDADQELSPGCLSLRHSVQMFVFTLLHTK